MKTILALTELFLLATTAYAAETDKTYTRNVAIVVYENAEPLDWTGPFEVYNDAASFGAVNRKNAFNVYIVSKTTEPLNAQGLKVVPNYSIENAPKPDIVVFPGGPANKIIDDPAFFAWAKKVSAEAEIAQSVCTGAFVLGKAGLLDNMQVTTFYGAIEGLRQAAPKAEVIDGRRFIDNGHILTTAGISAGIDGSLHIVARLLGRRVADQVSRYMEYHWSPDSYLATKYQYLNPSTDDQGRLLQTADMRREEKNYGDAIGIYRTVLKSDPANATAWRALAQSFRDSNDHVQAAQTYIAAAGSVDPSFRATAFYNAACEFALADRVDDAVEYLQKAYGAGMKNRDQVHNDPDLAKLRNDPRAQALAASK